MPYVLLKNLSANQNLNIRCNICTAEVLVGLVHSIGQAANMKMNSMSRPIEIISRQKYEQNDEDTPESGPFVGSSSADGIVLILSDHLYSRWIL